MSFRVVMLRRATADLQATYDWASNRAPRAANVWFERFKAALDTLAELPERCPLARENSKVSIELREFHFGRKPNVFRVVFTVEGDRVVVLRIRRAQRRNLSGREIGEPLDPET